MPTTGSYHYRATSCRNPHLRPFLAFPSVTGVTAPEISAVTDVTSPATTAAEALVGLGTSSSASLRDDGDPDVVVIETPSKSRTPMTLGGAYLTLRACKYYTTLVLIRTHLALRFEEDRKVDFHMPPAGTPCLPGVVKDMRRTSRGCDPYAKDPKPSSHGNIANWEDLKTYGLAQALTGMSLY